MNIYDIGHIDSDSGPSESSEGSSEGGWLFAHHGLEFSVVSSSDSVSASGILYISISISTFLLLLLL